MSNQDVKGFHPIYIVAILYATSIYTFPFIFYVLNSYYRADDSGLYIWPIALPLIWGLINSFIVIRFRKKLGRIRLLNCAIIIKYTLIPFFIVGGLIIAMAIFFMFTPVVVMIFIGPMVAITFSILGWTAMVGSAPYSIGYIRMSYKEGTHGKLLSIFAGILQFFFMTDVLSIMTLALKEKRCVKVTIAGAVVLFLATLISIILLVVIIIGALYASNAS